MTSRKGATSPGFKTCVRLKGGRGRVGAVLFREDDVGGKGGKGGARLIQPSFVLTVIDTTWGGVQGKVRRGGAGGRGSELEKLRSTQMFEVACGGTF